MSDQAISLIFRHLRSKSRCFQALDHPFSPQKGHYKKPECLASTIFPARRQLLFPSNLTPRFPSFPAPDTRHPAPVVVRPPPAAPSPRFSSPFFRAIVKNIKYLAWSDPRLISLKMLRVPLITETAATF
jgi:hypothetical protein